MLDFSSMTYDTRALDDYYDATYGSLDGPPFRIRYDREYELTVRQEPKQARMCGVGGKGASCSLNSSSFAHLPPLTSTLSLYCSL